MKISLLYCNSLESFAVSSKTLIYNDTEFESRFFPDSMRCIALAADNFMIPAMKEFVRAHKHILKKFRIACTPSIMDLVKDVYGDDTAVKFQVTRKASFLGGYTELCTLMCKGKLGGMIYLRDPMSSHLHQVDINCLHRQANVHDILHASNISSAYFMMPIICDALKYGEKAVLSSFLKETILQVWKNIRMASP